MRRYLKAALALTVFLGLSACGPRPGLIVEAFHLALDEDRTHDAAAMLSGGAAAIIEPDRMALALSGVADDYARRGGIQSIGIIDQVVDGSRATVEYIIRFGDDSTDEITDSLIRMGDEWKIIPD